MYKKFWASAIALAILTSSAGAVADPALDAAVVHFSSNIGVRTDTNRDEEIRLPPGYYLDEYTWKILDDEVKRLQDQEIRLGAENLSLRESASSWQPGWKIVLITLTIGVAGGWYLRDRL